MKNIGIFDSGIGGLNIALKLHDSLPVNITYLADNCNLPYGNKTDLELKLILVRVINWFISKDITEILIACNTASNYIDFLRSEFPKLKLFSIIEITASQFSEKELLIFATGKTTEKKIYDNYLQNKAEYIALNELAELIEKNNIDVLNRYIENMLEEYRGTKKTCLLGCTHYSVVHNKFKSILGEKVVDSVPAVLNFFKDYNGERLLTLYSSGDIELFRKKAYNIFGLDIDFNSAYID